MSDEPRRAPRLGPQDRLTPYITRHGRFRKIDPARDRPLPHLSRLLGVLLWGGVLVRSLRRARATVRAGTS